MKVKKIEQIYFLPHTAKLLILLLSFTAFSGCFKKGDEDPFISFRSRDTRVMGEWKLAEYESTYTQNRSECEGYSYTKSRTESFSGSVLTSSEVRSESTQTWNGTSWVWSCNDVTETEVIPYSYEIKINKDGTCSYTILRGNTTSTGEGQWFWLDGNKDKTTLCTDYDCFTVVKLSEKEMILAYEYYDKYTDEDGDWSEYRNTEKYVFEKK